ncbi:AsmA family protein [Noviherbaspirillum sp. CPCC 100848]|uniref:AsmA family protein n=1 Tax=Noviherbaspirillum album TaxID=3080276 RepID=A0ABU6JB34_9BURK|nr:AsmA family protein [Noviherbaspirillum sp. CPCC 100848]MEC4720648.1 AsmA family protein [Noviherbaspirillum sp. CPCC 100848]
MSRATHIAIGGSLGLAAVLAIVVAFLFAFDWNRARPWVGERIAEASGRSFEIRGDLSLVWRPAEGEAGWRAWIPWPHLQAADIVLGNAGWSSQPVMAQVAQVRFSVNPLGLLHKELRIPSLSLEAPQVLLERRKDGIVNWTFKPKDDSGWQTRIGRIAVGKGSVRLSDQQRRLELQGEVDTLDGRNSDPGNPYLLGWRIKGNYQGEPIRGNARSGQLAIQGSDARYPIEASLKLGPAAAQTQVDLQGYLDRPRDGPMLDLRVDVKGASLAQLYPLLGIALPDTRHYVTRGRLTGTPGLSWTYRDFDGRIGETDIAGELHFRLKTDGTDGRGGEALPRPRLEGRIVTNRLQFGDLAPLVGIKPGNPTDKPSDRLLPDRPWRPERWRKIDTDIEFTARSMARRELLPVDSLVTRIRLQEGVLTLAPLEAGMASGKLSATLRLDGGRQPLRGEMKLSARHLKLARLFDDPLMKGSAGEINADASLRGSGKSIAGLLAGADGELRSAVNGGTVSRLFLDKVGLNVSSMVAAQMFGDKQVKINCALTDIEIAKGVMRPRAFVIDTDEARISVDGTVDLGREKVALTVHPESKGWRLLSLRSPIHVDGNFRKREVTVDRGTLALKAGAAVALGLLGPAAALLPLVHVGPEEGSDCAGLLKPAGK